MFRQEINLYQAFQDPAPPTTFLGWHKMLICNLAFTAILTFMLIYSYVDHLFLDVEKKKLQNEVSTLETKFLTIKNNYPSVFFTNDVSQSIEKLMREMQSREKILRQIANQEIFSEDLEALSRVIIPDVWLTQIYIDQGGDQVSLKGKSLSVSNMQQFLIRLTADKAFINYALSVKNIQDNTNTESKGDLLFDITMVKNT